MAEGGEDMAAKEEAVLDIAPECSKATQTQASAGSGKRQDLASQQHYSTGNPFLDLYKDTQPSPQHPLMPDIAAWGRDDGEAVGVLPRPGEGSRVYLGEQASDLDSMTKETQKQKDKIISAQSHSNQHSGDTHAPHIGALSPENLREHATVISAPNEDNAGAAITTSVSVSRAQTVSPSSSCFALPVNPGPDPAALSNLPEKRGFQESASVSATQAGSAVARNIKRSESLTPRSSVPTTASEDQIADPGPRHLSSAASFKHTDAKKHSTPANAAASSAPSESCDTATGDASLRTASASTPILSASNGDYPSAPSNQCQWGQAATNRPDAHFGGAALCGIVTRERLGIAETEHAARMRDVDTVASDYRLWEQELGIRVRDADGAISLRRARQGWYSAPFRFL